MSAPAELDWRRLALTGTSLIEASAGTGKTWNIALLYLRLVLERELDARQVVVTTFTEAAAQELRARVRQRLADAEAALAAPELPANELQEYLEALVARGGRTPLLTRVRLALAEIDLAPITTIHGLCRRILGDFPFDTGMPFALGEIVDTPKLVRECVEDFWRARFLGDHIDPWEAAYALTGGVEALAEVVREILAVDEDAIDLEPSSGLRAWWQAFCARDLAQLRAKVDSGDGFARMDVSVLRKQLRILLQAAASGDPAGVDWDKLQLHLAPDKVRTAGLKNHHPPLADWPTIRLLVEARGMFARIPARVRHELALDCARFVRGELRRRLLQRGQASFSQLIDEVHARLAGPAGDQLGARLQQSWPVALIDEFQDTDARQWAIFDRVWRGAGPGGRALLLIGDPKQAIYGFRGGDVASYLNVRDALPPQRILSISRNYRSHPRLLLALNALYDRAGVAAFGDSGIDYVAVEAGEPARWRGTAIRQPLRLRLMPAASARKGDRDQAALEACVDDVAALLEDRVLGCGAGDVAVLLDSNARIRTLRRMLAARGIPVAGAGRANVLDSEWAEDVQLLLHALLEAGDEYAVRGALATRLLGRTAADLAQLAGDVAAWERTLEWFAAQHARWQRQGPLAVIESVLHQHAPRLLAAADGERALTDLRHLGELLQEAAAECYGPQELYAWYVAERARSGTGEEAPKERQLRIESEQQRVQLMTLHASKGLEFRAVFVPMAWRSREARASDHVRYHDSQRRLRLDLGSARLGEHTAIAAMEDLQERLRGLYVGVTRAVQLCTLYAFDDLAPQAHVGPAWRAALDVLLGAALASFGPAAGDPWAALAKALPSLRIEREPRVSQLSLLPPLPQRARRARSPLPPLRPLHGLYSFTALTRMRELALSEAARAAEDEGEDLADMPAEAPHPELGALAGLRGARFGDAIHGLLEDGRQGARFETQPERIRRALDRHSVRSGQAGDDAAAIAAVARLLDRTLDCELAPGLSLGGLPANARRAEFEFAFILDDARWWRLHALLDAHGLGHWWPPASAGESLRGLMKGYIDLVFAWDGRFHVLDYKSNWLGERLADYAPDALDGAIAGHHYGLQALIYTVALQRYLARRIADYQPERHLGESWYLFVRALGLAPGAGLWRKRFPQALVDALDALFDGTEASACA